MMSRQTLLSQFQLVQEIPKAPEICIAITVFERTEYIVGAIESALAQTVPVKVIVVEDCAGTSNVRDLVRQRFGNQIIYCRNAVRRGIFGNWNACVEYAASKWISILHDDDLLAPTFVADMLSLSELSGPKGAYFSRPNVLLPTGEIEQPIGYDFKGEWRTLDLMQLATSNLLLFPGQLLNTYALKAIGGFYERSQFAGDWDVWFKLTYFFGAAQTRAVSASVRIHEGIERGTNRVVRSGRKLALDFVQARRNYALLRRTDPAARFNRENILRQHPVSIRELAAILPGLSQRMVEYQWRLLLLSSPPNPGYAIIRALAKIIGPTVFQKAAVLLRNARFKSRRD